MSQNNNLTSRGLIIYRKPQHTYSRGGAAVKEGGRHKVATFTIGQNNTATRLSLSDNIPFISFE